MTSAEGDRAGQCNRTSHYARPHARRRGSQAEHIKHPTILCAHDKYLDSNNEPSPTTTVYDTTKPNGNARMHGRTKQNTIAKQNVAFLL